MAKNIESKFQSQKVIPFLTALPLTEFTKIQQVALCGDADLIIVCNGFPIYMELKKEAKEKAKPLQRYKLIRAERAGALSMVVYPENWEVCKIFLKSLLKIHSYVIRPELPECLQLKLSPSETQFFTTP